MAMKSMVKALEFLAFKGLWPGQARSLFNNHSRFKETYFNSYPGYYFSGDFVKRDQGDYYWLSGRVDDVINVSGHHLGTAEIESAIVLHKDVTEVAILYTHLLD